MHLNVADNRYTMNLLCTMYQMAHNEFVIHNVAYDRPAMNNLFVIHNVADEKTTKNLLCTMLHMTGPQRIYYAQCCRSIRGPK